MPRTQPGEVWLIDLGLVAKTRPCVVLSDFPTEDELALVVVVPHTTAIRNSRWELDIPKPFLKPGAFHLQQIQAISIARLQKRLGTLSNDEFKRLKETLSGLLKLSSG